MLKKVDENLNPVLPPYLCRLDQFFLATNWVIVVGGVSYLGHQNTKKCTINEMQMIGFEKTSRPFGFDDVLDQGLCRGLMLVKSASAEDWDLIVVNSVSARDKGHGNMNEE